MRRLLQILVTALLLCNITTIKAEDNAQAFFCYTGTHFHDDSNNDLYPFQGEDTIYLTMWKNDLANAKIAVCMPENNQITASMTPLSDCDDHTLEQVSISHLQTTSASLGWGMNYAPHVDIPEIITRDTSFTSTGTDYLWLSIQTDAEDTASYYTSVITIDDGTTTIDLNVHITVLDLTVPEEAFSLDLWQYPFSSLYYYDCLKEEEPFSEKHKEILRKELKRYHDAGGETITATVCDEPWSHQVYYDTPSLIRWNVDGSNYLWFDYTWFDEWVRLCMEEGIDERIDCFSILPFDNSITITRDDGSTSKLFLTPGSEEWNYYWSTFLYSFNSHLEENGWFDITNLFVDERGITYFNNAINLVDQIPGSNGSLKLASAVNVVPRDTELYDRISYLSISIASVDEYDQQLADFIRHRNDLGLDTTLYNCSTNYPNAFTVSDPVESIWTMWYAEHSNMNGYLRWALNAWTPDVNQTLDYQYFEAGDILLIYPDDPEADDPQPRSSVRMELIAQGVREIRKYHYLLEHLSDTSVLEEAVSSLERAYGTYNAYGTMLAKNDDARRLVTRESIRLENVLHYASYIALLEAQQIPHNYYDSLLEQSAQKDQYE